MPLLGLTKFLLFYRNPHKKSRASADAGIGAVLDDFPAFPSFSFLDVRKERIFYVTVKKQGKGSPWQIARAFFPLITLDTPSH